MNDKSTATFGVAMERLDMAAATLPVATFVIADTEWIECEDPAVGHLAPAPPWQSSGQYAGDARLH